uniref:Uncharacterized protein n=1 Tax=Rhizophora mucronata TaxID=61149 RepID=A0A2P2P1T4_RHIMU
MQIPSTFQQPIHSQVHHHHLLLPSYLSICFLCILSNP